MGFHLCNFKDPERVMVSILWKLFQESNDEIGVEFQAWKWGCTIILVYISSGSVSVIIWLLESLVLVVENVIIDREVRCSIRAQGTCLWNNVCRGHEQFRSRSQHFLVASNSESVLIDLCCHVYTQTRV